MIHASRKLSFLCALALSCGLVACGDAAEDEAAVNNDPNNEPGNNDPNNGEIELCFEPSLSAALCDPASATFTLASVNPFYPLTPGLRVVLEGDDGGEAVRIEREVLEETEVVNGVEAHVLLHKEFVDGELVEVARNFYVETTEGTVCYFGEDVENFDEEGVNNDGSWRAGEGGALPGIIMPAVPAAGQGYVQENAAAQDALDMGQIAAVGASRTINGEARGDVLIVMDSNPLKGCDEQEEKLYLPGVGEVSDNGVDLVDFTPGG